MIEACFSRAPSFSSLKAVANYTKTLSTKMRQACVSVASELPQVCAGVNSLFRAVSSALLICHGARDLRSNGWNSKVGWVSMTIGISGLSMEMAQIISCSEISKAFFSHVFSPCVYAPSSIQTQNVVALDIARTYGMEKEPIVTCYPTVWNPENSTFTTVCKTGDPRIPRTWPEASLYEVQCADLTERNQQIFYTLG